MGVSYIISRVGQQKITSAQEHFNMMFLHQTIHIWINRLQKGSQKEMEEMFINQIWMGGCLGGPLSKLCPTAPPFINDDSGRGGRTQFWKGPPKNHSCKGLFNLVKWVQRGWFKCDGLWRTPLNSKFWWHVSKPLYKYLVEQCMPFSISGLLIGRRNITVLIRKRTCNNLVITYCSIELKRTKLTSHTHTHYEWLISVEGW
jgi:hypothetical protein